MSIAELGTGRFGQLITRLLGIPGQPPVTEVGGTLDVGLTLENDRPEWGYLKGENRYSNYAPLIVGVGLLGAMRIRNPPGSGVIAIVESVYAASEALNDWILQLSPNTTVDLTVNPLTQGTAVDTRQGNAQGACILSASNDAALLVVGKPLFRVNSGSTFPIELLRTPVILKPGSCLDVEQLTTTIDSVVNIQWRERAATAPYELA